MSHDSLIRDALGLPSNAISYSVSSHLAVEYPDKAILQGNDHAFNVEEFAASGQCKLHVQKKVHSQAMTVWNGVDKRHARYLKHAWISIEWRDQVLDVLIMTWTEQHCVGRNYWIVAESLSLAERFFEEVCAWCTEIRGEVLVFAGGYWQKSAALYNAIQTTTFDNLVLPPALKQEIRTDFRSFFKSRKLYEQYGVPWKRGVLLIGPPGNGKTHTVKALLNMLGKPCLYVQSFKSQYGTDHDCIRDVFKRARETTPCVLVLEDLDSLIDGRNRSFFLNELDGFASNTGIVVLATTNHPERLDPSILERPSRFDRKYHFELPAAAERAAYLRLWNERLQLELQIPQKAAETLTAATDGFSYAYLKELILSSMMRWIGDARAGSLGEIAIGQLEVLKAQMASGIDEPAPDVTDVDTDSEEAELRSFADSMGYSQGFSGR